MKDIEIYDVAVIGAGMIGSSAAKYVAMESGIKCILIGPNEPQMGIHAAWFDEGRITRKLDKSPIWRDLGTKCTVLPTISISLPISNFIYIHVATSIKSF